ncbi:sigma-70 family RNA polymerase sigma factor [Actinacidiphila paucisporea]|uniref:RNA polymerase sigma-70 factor, ECF subfamily n=1 Tax=Actinacidiphila paucisporea TaxID=310782 RepID=A0A1M7EQR5_9ACTN|nr:sigma-70 family RNA polymerase sigma factor [Actinacidiphila paucisporea]SHL93839.1 RNA polymerase sigma-70 factor, ECF subfamily [Actinacidiphila paucisporea]
MATPAPPRWDRKMQQRLARGEEAALGELYDRYASLVHNLAHRVLDDDEAADLITREVFGYIWENPDDYDPKRGSLRSWIAALTQSQAVHRLRQYESRGHSTPSQVEARVREANTAARADFIVTSMPAPLRDALELAYRERLDYRDAAAGLGVSADESRRRLRLGLQLLSTAMDPAGSREIRPLERGDAADPFEARGQGRRGRP